MKVIAVIPAYNKEKFIADVIRETKRYCDDIIIVDDGSTDKTTEVAKRMGFKTIKHSTNMGVGAATRTGIVTALDCGADIIVTIDGDGQHVPSDIPKLLAALDNDTDIVTGSRFLGTKGVPAYRQFGIKVLRFCYNFGSKNKLSDNLFCFRVFKSKSLEKIDIVENGFGFCSEMLIKARHMGFKIKEVPANCVYHKKISDNSTFNPIKLGLIIGWKIIVWRLKIEH